MMGTSGKVFHVLPRKKDGRQLGCRTARVTPAPRPEPRWTMSWWSSAKPRTHRRVIFNILAASWTEGGRVAITSKVKRITIFCFVLHIISSYELQSIIRLLKPARLLLSFSTERVNIRISTSTFRNVQCALFTTTQNQDTTKLKMMHSHKCTDWTWLKKTKNTTT